MSPMAKCFQNGHRLAIYESYCFNTGQSYNGCIVIYLSFQTLMARKNCKKNYWQYG